MQRRFFSLSAPGRVRANNEDAVLVNPALGVALLADGMGGYQAGEVASAMATEWVLHELEALLQNGHTPSASDLRQWLRHSVTQANHRILDASLRYPQYRGMGTTLVATVFFGARLLVGHIGDSRLYRLRQGQINRLTRDHSLLQEQIDAGLISPALARQAPYKNLVTRAMGIAPELDLEVGEHVVQPGDTYLLCSDGLHDMLSDTEMAAILKREPTLEQAGQVLLDQANAAGGKDNISLVLVQCTPDPVRATAPPKHADDMNTAALPRKEGTVSW